MSRLTDDDRFLIAEARRIGPALRDGGVREQLAAQLLARLADLVTRLAGEEAMGDADDAGAARRAERIRRFRDVTDTLLAWCKRCRAATRSVPCPSCGGSACAVCGRCPSCDVPGLVCPGCGSPDVNLERGLMCETCADATAEETGDG